MSITALDHREPPRLVHSTHHVVLVVPPFQALQTPSLGVSQLKANAKATGFTAEVLYLNMLFADRIGPNLYEWLAATGPYLVGDFIFSRVAHPRTAGDVERYVEKVVKGSAIEGEIEKRFPGQSWVQVLNRLIEEARQFVENDAITEIMARKPWMTGFSSTFQANCSSLAVIRELKRRHPEVITVMGGANCETEMGQELMARYEELDFVGRGECDKTFVNLLNALRAGEPGTGIEGFLARGDGPATCPSHPLHGPDLDANPHPEFDDFFAQLERFRYRDQIRPGLAMETSRGCWWGAKSHCTFCAFNRDGMVFRAKQPERALEELQSQVKRYGLPLMEMTDNILDMGYLKTLLPEMAKGPVAELFWETKANLQQEHIRLFRRAGIKWIQPGIESLSDKTLKLMRKGSSQLQNIALLKACTESGIRITWNWLFGFPGENEEELDDLARVVQAIHHLQPPSSAPVLYMERFAPYQMTPQEWGLEPIRPAAAYHHCYPFPEESLRKIAFFWECDFFKSKEQGTAHRRLQGLVSGWNGVYGKSHLVMVPRKKSLLLLDTRACATQFTRRLTGLHRKVYEYCSEIRGLREVQRTFEAEASAEQIAEILQSFVDGMIALESGGRYLSLATDTRLGYKQFPYLFPGGSVLPAPAPKRSTAEKLRQLGNPKTAAAIAARRLRRLRFDMTNRVVRKLSTWLAQPGPRLAPNGEAAVETSAPASRTMTGT
jgi:ribosomal peptide maturation radical SAM protein 1